ncbi:hypothetical protein GC177_01145 [bacterium]|nr:hypothetical protein [bacterium]
MRNNLKHTAPAAKQDMRAKRVIWLNNHTTARMVECELLRHFGYEVFTPKYVPRMIRSASVDYSYDNSLSIPAEDLAILNSQDFYQNDWPLSVHAILNEYFGTAIIGCYSWISEEFINHFRGKILLRSYGPTRDDYTIWRFFDEVIGPGFMSRISGIHDRIWFAQAYPNLVSAEPDFFIQRAVTLPTGIPKHFYAERGCYQRKYEKMLMVLPDILADDHQSVRAYHMSRKYFKGIPKIIAGNQFVPVENDPEVTGLLPAGMYDKYLKGCAAMFYHNELPRHIHFHPVEAACYGMPVIFMASGMISYLGGKDSPGSAKTYAEARKKIKRIMKGDESFIQEVVESQREWVDYFSWDENLKAWKEQFQQRIAPIPVPPSRTQRMRIALLVSGKAGWYAHAYIDALATGIKQGMQAQQVACDVVIGIESNHINNYDTEWLRSAGWQVRPFKWETISNDALVNSMCFTRVGKNLQPGNHIMANDSISCFEDCNMLYILAQGLDTSFPIAPVKPFVLHVDSPIDYCPGSTTPHHTLGYATAMASGAASCLNDAWEHFAFDHKKSYVTPLRQGMDISLGMPSWNHDQGHPWLLLPHDRYTSSPPNRLVSRPVNQVSKEENGKESNEHSVNKELETASKPDLIVNEKHLLRQDGPISWLKLQTSQDWKISIRHMEKSSIGTNDTMPEILPHNMAEHMLVNASYIWMPAPTLSDIPIAWMAAGQKIPLLLPEGEIAATFAQQGADVIIYHEHSWESWMDALKQTETRRPAKKNSAKPHTQETARSDIWRHLSYTV